MTFKTINANDLFNIIEKERETHPVDEWIDWETRLDIERISEECQNNK